MRRRNCKLRDFPLQGAKINCARFGRKLGSCQNNESISEKHQYFVTGDNHNNVRFYEFLPKEDENQLLSFSSNVNSNVQSEVSAVAISWEQSSIFSGSNRGIINVWDILEGKNAPVCTLKGHATSVNCFGLFPGQQNLIASGSYDTQIKLWDYRQKQNFATLKGHQKQINSIDISPDGSCLLSGSQDGTTKLWDISTQKVITTYTQHSAPVLRAIFNPQDCMFASCSADRTAKYFSCDVNKKTYIYVSSTELVSVPITAIDFNLQGTYLCTGANDILKIWDMRRNGCLVESIDSAWKGVQDLLWCQNRIKGISSSGGNLSTWFCYLGQKNQSPDKKQQQAQLKLPKIFKNPSLRRQNNSSQQRRIRPAENFNSNKQIEQNQKIAQRNKDLQQVMNNVNLALGHLNNVTEMKNKQKEKDLQAKRQAEKEKEKQRREQERIKDQQRKQRIRVQKQKEREQKQAKQRERRQKIQRQKQEQQRMRQEKLQQLQRQRLERQKQLQKRIHETFQNNNGNMEMTLENDLLENSDMVNLSVFMGNGAQKQKLMQIQFIGQFMKSSGRLQQVYKFRSNIIKPIIHFWKQGKIDCALQTLSSADMTVAYDCISAILHNSTFKMGLNPEAACIFIQKLMPIMQNKHSTYVKNSMLFLNEIVLMFKDQLIRVKMFNPMAKVDLTRQQKLAKYDKLTQNFLNVFKHERLKKYAVGARIPQNQELNNIASELYKNLEQVLRKIMPRKEPEPA